MSNNPQRYLITAALPYANGPIHIGHLAGCHLPADIYTRFRRMQGHEVLFICGTDEHGVPITLAARKEGTTPQAVADKYHEIIDKALYKFGISFDNFSRTTSEVHRETATDFFLDLYNKNLFEEKTEEQFYDEDNKQFLADRYIMGTCPKCGNDRAYGDQCEKCGSTLNPRDLINPHSTISSKPLVLKETKHWYIPLDKYENWLREWILVGHKDDWKTNVYGQCKSWIDGGLQPRAVTRDLDWGVPVPLPNAEGKVLYVWFDAPIGYISATKEITPDWKKFWCDEKTHLVHFLGKDNIVFHCIIFPTMLKMHGDYILPENVPANEFLNLEGDKISTSRNWAVWLHEYLEEFPEQQDVLRYVLAANAPETKDNDFTWKDFQDRCNSELVSVLGNFFNRTIVLSQKFCGSKIPKRHDLATETERNMWLEFDAIKKRMEESMSQYRLREALAEMMNAARLGNKYLTEQEPWKKAKGDVYVGENDFEQLQNKYRVENCLHHCLQLSANLAILMYPFMPFTAKKILMHFNITKKANELLMWENAGRMDLLSVGYTINNPVLLFRKIEDEEIEKQVEKLKVSKAAYLAANTPVKAPEPIKPEISFDDFAKMDLRIGTITEAEKVPKADKLLKLTVDLGFEKRTVVSGIALHYKPEEIIGQQVTLLCNLAPRKMKGIESQGMILMAEDGDGKLKFMMPISATANGSGVS